MNRTLLTLLLALVALPARAAEPFFFLHCSDPQFGFYANNKDFAQETANFEFVVATANRLRPAFVVITGDLVNKPGDAAQLAEFWRIARKLDPAIKLYPVPGNHDVGNAPTADSIAAYRKNVADDHYAIRLPDFTALVLNGSLIAQPKDAPAEYQQQLDWLKRELADAQAQHVKHIVVFQHQPYFISVPDEKDQYFNVPLERRTVFLDLFKRSGVSHVFAGHTHQPYEAHNGDLQMIVTGAVSKPLGKSKSGLRVVAVKETGIDHRWYELGELPNKIDLSTWPAGEMLKDKPAKKQP